MWPKLVCAKY